MHANHVIKRSQRKLSAFLDGFSQGGPTTGLYAVTHSQVRQLCRCMPQSTMMMECIATIEKDMKASDDSRACTKIESPTNIFFMYAC